MKKSRPSNSESKHYAAEKLLPHLFSPTRRYINLDTIKSELETAAIQFQPSTLKSYLHEWQKSGILHDAGRGWYSDLPQAFLLNTQPLDKLELTMEKHFPLLDWTAWSTRQIAAYFHHLPTRHATFLMVDRDALGPVAEALKEDGYNVITHPLGNDAKKFTLEHEETIILRPRLSTDHTTRHAPIEQILVDLFIESKKLGFMDESETSRIISNVSNYSRIELSVIEMYAKRRKPNDSAILQHTPTN